MAGKVPTVGAIFSVRAQARTQRERPQARMGDGSGRGHPSPQPQRVRCGGSPSHQARPWDPRALPLAGRGAAPRTRRHAPGVPALARPQTSERPRSGRPSRVEGERVPSGAKWSLTRGHLQDSTHEAQRVPRTQAWRHTAHESAHEDETTGTSIETSDASTTGHLEPTTPRGTPHAQSKVAASQRALTPQACLREGGSLPKFRRLPGKSPQGIGWAGWAQGCGIHAEGAPTGGRRERAAEARARWAGGGTCSPSKLVSSS